MSPFLDRAAVAHIRDGHWVVLRDLRYCHRDYGLIVVPEGFRTDKDSVPRLPVVYWLVKDAAVESPITHDWLYAHGKVGDTPITRKEADRIFLDAMEEEGVSWWRRRLIYRGVRLGGMFAWNRYRDGEDEEPDFV